MTQLVAHVSKYPAPEQSTHGGGYYTLRHWVAANVGNCPQNSAKYTAPYAPDHRINFHVPPSNCAANIAIPSRDWNSHYG